MNIILDECLPRPLAYSLKGHDVKTVPQMGWASIKNGELLKLINEHGFDVFVTVDRNLTYQQSQTSMSGIATIVLSAMSNRLTELQPLVPNVLQALETIRKGDIVRIGN